MATGDAWEQHGDAPPPRRPGWGCLAAMIVSGIGLIVILAFAANLLAAAFDGVRIR
jgi:hypothetical protein